MEIICVTSLMSSWSQNRFLNGSLLSVQFSENECKHSDVQYQDCFENQFFSFCQFG